jgi:hypothetical protein
MEKWYKFPVQTTQIITMKLPRRLILHESSEFSVLLTNVLNTATGEVSVCTHCLVHCGVRDGAGTVGTSQGGSGFNTPRSENNSNFSSNAQQKAAIRGGQRGALQFSVSFPYSQRIQPTL